MNLLSLDVVATAFFAVHVWTCVGPVPDFDGVEERTARFGGNGVWICRGCAELFQCQISAGVTGEHSCGHCLPHVQCGYHSNRYAGRCGAVSGTFGQTSVDRGRHDFSGVGAAEPVIGKEETLRQIGRSVAFSSDSCYDGKRKLERGERIWVLYDCSNGDRNGCRHFDRYSRIIFTKILKKYNYLKKND